jgi:hypothetical protein|tara:strand:- start:1000 stop:1218 length:219 start_codon:yes stop_codon:yes gene_type:complete
MPVVDGKHYAYTPAGIAASKRAKNASTAGGKGSLYGKNHRQKPPVQTHGTFNPASPTENISAERTVKRSDVV